ncbi:LuxR C-terminal-related transcriptional regulator [Streptomyces sp. NPDC006733]|uniref:response regulator transcription factor n=1 Tax=Streptomyces sp. NPDC006733 TaxID=3155460 RepID=UPI0033DC2C39
MPTDARDVPRRPRAGRRPGERGRPDPFAVVDGWRVASAANAGSGAGGVQSSGGQAVERTGLPAGPTPFGDAARLTARQLQVLHLLAAGLRNVEIAARLSLSVRTVEHHVAAVLGKLRVRSRHDAAPAARRLGIVRPPAGRRDAAD